ncbi:hypothetical protein U1707_15500 [Sphingomonas sp. PB2P12]|uniref:hypothetical protein n=1 Tax=Sphingomonas sandaracina TaxID=3096157 RepID=UPI002FC613EE
MCIAALVQPHLYETIEWSLATALPIMTVLIGTPLQALARQRLVRNEDGHEIWLLLFLACAGCATIGAVALLLSLEIFALVVAIGGAVAIQMILAEWSRSGPPSLATAWLDGLPLLLSATIVGCLALAGSAPAEKPVAASLIVVSAGSGVAAAIKLRNEALGTLASKLRQSFNAGRQMAAAALFGVWLGVSGRVLVGLVCEAHLATYALAFRLAGVALIVHQIGLTLFYRRIFTARTRSADRLLSPLLAGGWLLAGLVALIGPAIARAASMDVSGAKAGVVLDQILPIVALQTGFWVGYALLQARVYRLGLAKALLPWAVGIAALFGTAIVLFAAAGVGVVGLSWLLAGQSAACFLLALMLLARSGLPHVRTGWTGAAGGIALTAIALLRMSAL